MSESAFNRQARRSGGNRPFRFNLPDLSKDDLEILAQEAIIRQEFGEEGVKRFWEMIPAAETCTCWKDSPRTYEQRSLSCPIHGDAGEGKQ